MKFIWFRILRWWYGEVSPQEAKWAILNYNHTTRIYLALAYKSMNRDYHTISKTLGCTRERVRQMILKGIRQARNKL